MNYDNNNNRNNRPSGPDFTPGCRPPNHGPGSRPPMPPGAGPGPMEPGPKMAPPNFVPPAPAMHGGTGGLRFCLRRNTYIWLNNGDNFWFFPTFISRDTMFGFRWWGFGWVFQRVNINRIHSFQCF